MIDLFEAQSIVFAKCRRTPLVEVALMDALYRTLARSIGCDVDYPPFDRSLMDGYVVRSADTANVPATLSVVGQIAAGTLARSHLSSGCAMQINTGAPIPLGADSVVRLEDAEPDGDGSSVLVRVTAVPGQFITRRATYVSAGTKVLDVGTRLMPGEIAVAATAGVSHVAVYRRPTVAVLVTGAELIDIDQVPSGPMIRNSNQYLLHALILASHARPQIIGVVGDDRDEIRNGISKAKDADVLCITGGVSVGKYDFVPEVLGELKAEIHFHKMSIKPGRPVLFATLPSGTLVFALPGNPVSAFVGFHLLVRPALGCLEGRPGETPIQATARLVGRLEPTTVRRSFWPAKASYNENGGLSANVLNWHGSGDPFGLATANALIMRLPGSPAIADGEDVTVLLFEWV